MRRGMFVLAALAAVLVFGQLGGARALGAPDGDPPGLARALAVQEAHTDALLARAGVVGTAVGASEDGRSAAVLVLVEHGGVAGIPPSLDGVPARVVVTGRLEALYRLAGQEGAAATTEPALTTTSRWPRPVPIGVSTGHPSITAGTIGARVTKADGSVYALSNNHVYANENRASAGDAVIQPGRYDGGTSPADDMGTLAAFVPIVFSTAASNTVDAAIALSSTSSLGRSTPPGGYGTPKAAMVAPGINMAVQKYGRTTGLTKGKIIGINATVNIGYDSGVARFVQQIIVQPGAFSRGGDSGSLIVARGGVNDRRPVGLLYAGSATVTIANPISAVLSALGVTIDGE